MKKRNILLLLLQVILTSTIHAQSWIAESEDHSSVTYGKDGVIDIVAPKGLTLWYKEKMTGNTVIEYEACIVTGGQLSKDVPERLSDLNCFWMASEADSTSVLKHTKQRYGKFINQYALKLYYMGYGGNYNSTTRFRRYTGDVRGVDSANYRPRILKEYTDKAHLLKPNHWYKIRLEQIDGRVRYIIDGECIVDYIDPKPLREGHFGFRTTLAHARLRNFKYTCSSPDNAPIVLRRIEGKGYGPTTFGVPFSLGEVNKSDFTLKTDKGDVLPFETWTLARWQDGSTKWQAFSTIVGKDVDSLLLFKQKNKSAKIKNENSADVPNFQVTLNGKIAAVKTHEIESKGDIRTVHKYTGDNFIIRAYTYKGSEQVKLVHTLLVDSTLNASGLHELSIHFKVPMHGKEYERYVDFGQQHMDVQPLIARRRINLDRMDSVTKSMIKNIAKWDGFRLSQLSPKAFSIRKRATSRSPWIGTIEGERHDGTVTVGDSTESMSFTLKDFWQSYPSTIQVDNARSDTATVTLCLWSPEAEPFSFEHYDTIAHTLEAAYEDVQPGLSTALGIGRTSTIYISRNKDDIKEEVQFVCTPEYLHRKRAFGIWSLPTIENERDRNIEQSINIIMTFYKSEIDRNNWYGFWNYGDIMHSYDMWRKEWRYDVGGYAWDNTELGSPAMFWYQFLRTGDADVWRMASSMTRHCSEVDTYHFGPNAGLGTRHNVSHWGCGAKESRVSEAWWNRFYYYLTADERIGDIMHDVVDADTILYTLDPMRLAQPRSLYPCSAPARLRIGPDWLGYVSNWLTEWERKGNTKYRDKILTGMTSIGNLPHGIFTGPLALGYDPATGVISTDMDSLYATNHLMTIMGGFELVNELEPMIDCPKFYEAWLDHAARYQEMALKVTGNKFLVPRLTAYGAWRLGDEKLKERAWKNLLQHNPLQNDFNIWTNDCATWTVDAIFMKEVIR
ncbi:MAG: DUF1080 domain-containing protein [Bacteroidaceae bacterium]|nr:DUF1080 domain-containing protein [Bacteroidaceae bacterium]